MVTAVAMDSRVQKLPRVRGGSYRGTYLRTKRDVNSKTVILTNDRRVGKTE